MAPIFPLKARFRPAILRPPILRPAFLGSLLLALATPLLQGCANQGLVASVSIAQIKPEASSLAIAGIFGPSPEVAAKFGEILANAARARGFTITDANAHPATRINAYLDLYQVEGGALAISWVLNGYGEKSRNARVSGAASLKASAASGWESLDEAAMRSIAARGLDDLTQVLIADASSSAASGQTPPTAASAAQTGEE